MKWLESTLAAPIVAAPASSPEEPQPLSSDMGDDGGCVRETTLLLDLTPHIRGRGEERRLGTMVPRYRAKRWVVERTQRAGSTASAAF